MNKLTLFALSLLIFPVNAQTFFEKESAFLVTQDCVATDSIKRDNEKNAFQLEKKTYSVLGLNKEGGTHAFILTPKGKKWVDLKCGEYSHFDFKRKVKTVTIDRQAVCAPGKCDPNQRLNTCTPNDKSCAQNPFFDNIDNPVKVKFGGTADMTPLRPSLSSFDQKLLMLCGKGFNADVDLVDFQEVIANNDRILPTLNIDLEEFRALWFKGDGFKHIFCGEKKPDGSLWGLHWAPRYYDLQQQGIAWRLPNNTDREEVIPGHVYTIGVGATIDNKTVTSPVKGYPLSISTEDLFIAATKVYLKNPNPGEPQACMTTVKAPDGTKIEFLFASKNGGIRTFYPDATPDKSKARCKE